MVEIALRFFIHAMDNLSYLPEILRQIQLVLNNTSSSTTSKTPNKIAYGFSLRRSLDLYLAIASPNIYIAHTKASDTIFFAPANQKEHYDMIHSPLFMKVRE